MRKIADVPHTGKNAVRLMICDKGKGGVFVFGFMQKEDGPSAWDALCMDLEEAYELGEEYGISREDWTTIEDPLPDCQDDWIHPVRVKGRNLGRPEWGKWEALLDGEWVEVNGE